MLDQRYLDDIIFTPDSIEPGFSFANTEFVECQFNDLDLSAISFKNSKFLECSFEKCNLSNIDLIGSTFRDISFAKSKILGANFSNCNSLLELSFEDCLMDFCVFQGIQVQGLKFQNCSLGEADFSESKIIKSNFSGSDLREALFNSSDVSGSDFRGSKNYLIDPQFTKIKKAKFSLPEALSLLRAFDIIVE